MRQEVVRDFLNLPGIVGIALVDGRSRPFFLGIDQTLNFQQKEALAQGIQQVIETTPSNFEFFEFKFSGHQVYIYKLDHGIILLVLTSGELVYSSYASLISQLKAELQEDLNNAIANFRLVAGNVTLSGLSYWNRPAETQSSPEPGFSPPLSPIDQSAVQDLSNPLPATNGRYPEERPKADADSSNALSSKELNVAAPQTNGTTGHEPQTTISSANNLAAAPTETTASPSDSQASPANASKDPVSSAPAASVQPQPAPSLSGVATPPAESSTQANQLTPAPTQKSTENVPNSSKSGNTADVRAERKEPITLKEILAALNQFSNLAAHYLGATIVANYWKSSRPPIEWLSNFEVDRNGQIAFSGPMTPGKAIVLNSEQHQWLRDWVAAFIQRCSRVIRDFPKIIQKMDLEAEHRALLLSDTFF